MDLGDDDLLGRDVDDVPPAEFVVDGGEFGHFVGKDYPALEEPGPEVVQAGAHVGAGLLADGLCQEEILDLGIAQGLDVAMLPGGFRALQVVF